MGTDQEFEAEIDRLAALQEFDRTLKERVDRVDVLSAAADECEAKLNKRRETVGQLTAQREALEKQRKEMDQRLEVDGGRMRDNRMRMSRVKTDRELMAIQREIDLGKEAKAHLEEEMLVVMETLERIAVQLLEEGAVLAELEEKAAVQIVAPRSEASELSEGLDDAKARREELASAIDRGLRGKYEQIFRVRGGTAVVEARSGVCTGCRMSLPPQLFNELQRYREVRQCPSCHRIIFFRQQLDESA